MRNLISLFAVASLIFLGACERSCEDDGYLDSVPDLFSVKLVSGSGIAVEWDLGTVGEVWLEDDSGGILWHVRCRGETDDQILSCLNSPINIQEEAPLGADIIVEAGTPSSSAQYHFVVQEHERQCPGQLRGGESVEFSITMSR